MRLHLGQRSKWSERASRSLAETMARERERRERDAADGAVEPEDANAGSDAVGPVDNESEE
jgi:hypothetical protein